MPAVAPQVLASDSVKSSFQITAADGGTLPIPAGAYYFNTKARNQRLMRNSLSSEARQVHACLEAATMFWKRELALGKDGQPLTPADIAKQTELSPRQVRFAFEELEQQGLAARTSDDGGPLRRGHMQIYSWAFPRSENSKKECGSAPPHSSLHFPDWFPESWAPLKPLINRLKLKVSIDEEEARSLIDEGDEVARLFKEANDAAARFVKRVCAQSDIYKEERTDKTEEKEREEEEPTPPPPPAPKHEPLRMPEPLSPLPGKTEPEPETALVPAEDPRREMAWNSLRATFDGCGKPISVRRSAACREEFFKHPLEGQLFIAQDATIRAHELWNEAKWTPDPLDYLKSRIWDEKPVKRRTLPETNGRKSKEELREANFKQYLNMIRSRSS